MVVPLLPGSIIGGVLSLGKHVAPPWLSLPETPLVTFIDRIGSSLPHLHSISLLFVTDELDLTSPHSCLSLCPIVKRQDMRQVFLIKKAFNWELPSSFRGVVHCHHGMEHEGSQAGAEEELRATS